jgi:hypothetical protein
VISGPPEVVLAIASEIDQAFKTFNGDERW